MIVNGIFRIYHNQLELCALDLFVPQPHNSRTIFMWCENSYKKCTLSVGKRCLFIRSQTLVCRRSESSAAVQNNTCNERVRACTT